MFDKKPKVDHHPICNLVPGFAFYNNIGLGLAENLVDLVESVFEWHANIKRKLQQQRSAVVEPRNRLKASSTLASQHDAG